MKNIPLYRQIINDLLKQIITGELRPGDRVSSESELSRQYRVSSITSKNALIELADKGYIIRIKGKGSFVNSLENLELLPNFSNTTNYRKSMRTKAIGYIAPSMKTDIDKQLLNQIESEISNTDYVLTLIITRENPKNESAAIQKLTELGVSGLIIFPTESEIYNEEILKLSIKHFPFVLVDRYLKGLNTNCVYTNNYEIAKKAVTDMIIDGADNIAFISPDSRNTVTSDRLSGFKDAFYEKGIPLSPENICMINLSITSPSEKIKIIENFLKKKPKINGLFLANKEYSNFVSKILDKDKLWNKYNVCAFDHSDNKYISYIEQDIAGTAKECVSILTKSIQGSRECTRSVIPSQYIKRNVV